MDVGLLILSLSDNRELETPGKNSLDSYKNREGLASRIYAS